MTLQCVPTVRTQFTILDFTKAIITVFQDLTGRLPSKQSAGVIYAQWALETGQGLDCWNYNIANVKAVDHPGQLIKYCMLANVWEVINGQKVMFQPPSPVTWFRAFDTLAEGVRFQFKFLESPRYQGAWQSVVAGDPKAFAHNLKVEGYYTADETQYTNAVVNYFNRFVNGNVFDTAMAGLNQQAPVIPPPATLTPVVPSVVVPPPPPPVTTIPEVTIVGKTSVAQQVLQFFVEIFDAIVKKI